MATFRGRLWLANDPSTMRRVEIEVEPDGSLAVTAGDLEVAHWSPESIVVVDHEGELRIRAEGEELVFVAETPGFVAALRPEARLLRASRSDLALPAAALSIGGLAVLVVLLGSPLAGVIGGLVGAALGGMANRGTEWWRTPVAKSLATAALAAGIMAITLGVIRFDG